MNAPSVFLPACANWVPGISVCERQGGKGLPGGRPRKYPDKATAKAADRLRAVERKATAKKAPRKGHAVGGKAVGGSPLTLLELLNVHHVIHPELLSTAAPLGARAGPIQPQPSSPPDLLGSQA